MTDPIKAWQCIGCGRIEAPQNCVGICQDRKVEFVYAFEHAQALAQVDQARKQVAALGALVRKLVSTMPRDGEWQRSYLALQDEARRMLATLAQDQA